MQCEEKNVTDMKTYILFWNPAISDLSFRAYSREYLRNVGNVITWELRDFENVEPGDRVFWLRCGEGKTGILMVGTIYESPFQEAHWKNPGETTSYAPFLVEFAVDPEEVPIITTEMLQKEMPDFEWNGGHSGRLLCPEYAETLELMWARYVLENHDMFESKSVAACDESVLDKFQPANKIIQEHMARVKGGTCEVCGYDFYKVFGEDVDRACEYDFLFHDGKVCENIEDNFHAFCPSCKSVLRFPYDMCMVEHETGRSLLDNRSERVSVLGGMN